MKPVRIFSIVIMLLLAGSLIRSAAVRMSPAGNPPGNQNALHAIFPDAFSFRELSDAPVYAALDHNGQPAGYAFYTQHLVSGISGYGGPIHLLVGISPAGEIIKAVITAHQETPGFMGQINALLTSIAGSNIQTPIVIGKTVDGITGATVTSEAIADTLNAAFEKIAPLLSLERPETASQQTPLFYIFPVLTGMLLFFLAGWACLKRKPVIRWAALLSGFVLLGLLAQNMLSTSHAAGLALFQLPSWAGNPLWYVLMIGAVISCLIIGRVYCAGVCPFGFVEECLYAVNTKLFRAGMSPDQRTDSFCRWIKYIILAVILLLCLFYGQSGIGAVEVYITLFTASRSLPALILLLTVLAGSFFFMRFWCRYLCPFGAFLAAISQFRPCRQKSSAPACADRAECFYCSHCVFQPPRHSTKPQTVFFICLLTVSVTALGFSVSESVRRAGTAPDNGPEKTLAAENRVSYIDTSAVKKKLSDAGIIPHPAKYWRTLNDE